MAAYCEIEQWRKLTEIGRFTETFIRKIEIVCAGTARRPLNLPLEHISEIVAACAETVAHVLIDWKRQGWLAIDALGCHFSCLDRLRALLPG